MPLSPITPGRRAAPRRVAWRAWVTGGVVAALAGVVTLAAWVDARWHGGTLIAATTGAGILVALVLSPAPRHPAALLRGFVLAGLPAGALAWAAFLLAGIAAGALEPSWI